MGFLSKDSKPKKKKGIGRIKRFEPLFDPEDAIKVRDVFINKVNDNINARKRAILIGKNIDPMVITDAFMMNNEFIPTQVLESLPTGDIRFDIMCSVDKFNNRGIPRGKAMEISGPEEMMKSARAASIVAAIQQDPRGAIVVWYETESKVNQKYVKAAGADIDRIILEIPDYVEQVYYSMREHMIKYKKERDKFVAQYIKKLGRKSISDDELDVLIFRGRMSFPILLFVYDSIGNHQSREGYQKDESGKTTATIGKHAQAHANGFRSIISMMGNTMSILIGINHTKDEMGGNQAAWGTKRTTTYGGKSLKYMNSVRIEQRGGIGGHGAGSSSFLRVTRGGKALTIGKWLTTKFIKNSLVPSSKEKIESCLFRYKPGVGFDMGVSYILAMERAGMLKGKATLGRSKKNKIIVPGGGIIEANYSDLHEMLATNPELRAKLRTALINHANESSVLVRRDV